MVANDSGHELISVETVKLASSQHRFYCLVGRNPSYVGAPP